MQVVVGDLRERLPSEKAIDFRPKGLGVVRKVVIDRFQQYREAKP